MKRPRIEPARAGESEAGVRAFAAEDHMGYRVVVPDRRVRALEEGWTTLGLRGFEHVVAVRRADGVCVGWGDKDDLEVDHGLVG